MIPKETIENIDWRLEHMQRAESDAKYQHWLTQQLAVSPILAFNLIFFTETFFDVLDDGVEIETQWKHRPFITYPCQDREILRIQQARGAGLSIRGVKSRSMGWSWLLVAMAVHGLLFEQSFHALFMSRKEEEVDAGETGKPDSLFAKARYLIKHAPPWLTSQITNKDRSIGNKRNGSHIGGESTNSSAGASGRRSIVVIDEAAAIDNLEPILRSTNDNTKVRIAISTPRRGSYFNRMFSDPGWLDAAMPWYEHPERGRNRRRDATTYTGWTSDWYEIQRNTRTDQDLAENVDMAMDHAGTAVFDIGVLQRHRQDYAMEPRHVGDIIFANELDEDFRVNGPTNDPEKLFEADRRLLAKDTGSIRFQPRDRGQWKLWCDLIYDPNTGLHRPPQSSVYALACDPGGGRRRANSVISVVDVISNEQVAEWASADYTPPDCARIMVAAALFFGGIEPAVIGWECNGPGGALTVGIPNLGWPSMYRRENRSTGSSTTSPQLGWFNNKNELRLLFEELQDDLASGAMVIRSADCLHELESFIFDEHGTIVTDLTADLNTGAREAHGDRGVANGILNRLRRRGGGGDPRAALERAATNNPRTFFSISKRVEAERKRSRAAPRLDYRKV